MKRYILIPILVLSLAGCSDKPKSPATVTAPESQVSVPQQALTQSNGGSVVVSVDRPVARIQIAVTPQFPKRGDTLKIQVTGATEGSSISYNWKLNGTALSESGPELKLDQSFKRGDSVDCAIVVDERGVKNTWSLSSVLGNAAPVIEGQPTILHVAERKYKISFKASDPDGDQLIYSLKQPVPGAAIASDTGEITYEAPAGTTGKVEMLASVSDGNGGESLYNVVFELQ